jgi:predicted dehydrogenase
MANTSIIRWGIIGCGDVTEVKSGPAFNKVPNSKLVAVMRRNADKAKDYAQRHAVEKWYNDASALINNVDVDAIYIATPPLQHEEYAIKALRAGKPVYVEKPMAIDAASAQRMTDAANETGIKLSVAHYRRQQPLFLKIKELVNEKAIGDVQLINLQLFYPPNTNMIAKTDEAWRLNPAISGGGLFHDLAPHQLDLMLYFFGEPVKASGMSFNASQLYNADDTVSGQFVFNNNILFNGVWSFRFPYKKDECEIIGTGGSLRFSIFDHQPLVILKDGKETIIEFDKLQHVQQPMVAKVVEYFLDKSSNPCNGREGVAVMKMIEAFTKN